MDLESDALPTEPPPLFKCTLTRTLVTLEGPFGAVDVHVSPELGVADKAQITLGTLEGLDAVVHFLVVT